MYDIDDAVDTVEVERLADDVMVEVSLLLEVETVLLAYEDGDVELELVLGVTPAGTVSAGNVGLDAVVDSETDMDDVIDVTDELWRVEVTTLVVDDTELEDDPVPCRGTNTWKSTIPPTAGCCTFCSKPLSCDAVRAGAREEYVRCNESMPWECDAIGSAGAVLLSRLNSGSTRELDSFRRLRGGAMAASSIRHQPPRSTW